MKWEALILNIMLEFFNTFIIKSTNIYFGYKDKVYVITKQLIIDVLRICGEGYVEDPKGQVSRTIAYKFSRAIELNPQILLEISGM
jgi:hypothetical protein